MMKCGLSWPGFVCTVFAFRFCPTKMRTMLPRRRRTLRLPSHFWYLVERVAYMLSVVRVDADLRRAILAAKGKSSIHNSGSEQRKRG